MTDACQFFCDCARKTGALSAALRSFHACWLCREPQALPAALRAACAPAARMPSAAVGASLLLCAATARAFSHIHCRYDDHLAALLSGFSQARENVFCALRCSGRSAAEACAWKQAHASAGSVIFYCSLFSAVAEFFVHVHGQNGNIFFFHPPNRQRRTALPGSAGMLAAFPAGCLPDQAKRQSQAVRETGRARPKRTPLP